MSPYERLVRELGGSDPYAVLGVGRLADRAEIRRAYRTRARAHHPDNPAARGPEAARTMQLLTVSHELLARWRDVYDARHTRVAHPIGSIPAPRRPPVPRPAATVPARGAAGPVACFSASGNHFATGYPRPVRQPQPAATVDQGRSVSAGQPDGRAPRRDDRQRVRDHLGLSIVATILCAPVGALGLLHALRAADHLARGDVPGARRVARRGRAWSLAATAAGMLLLAALAATGGGHRG